MRKGYSVGGVLLALLAGGALGAAAPGVFAAVEAATGTNVVVTNVPLPVVLRGRTASIAQNVIMFAQSTYTSPFVKASDCQLNSVYVTSNETQTNDLSVNLVPSLDGTTGFGSFPPRTVSGATGRVIYNYAPANSEASGIAPAVAPFVAIAVVNLSGNGITLSASLFCVP